ncbi:MAG: hypothetical protein D0530_12785 [Methylococcales bacterium]|nr:MAG: hypothetical protein D0530_12785 [Methylococcales bacterium]
MDKFNKNCLLSLIVVIGVLNVNQVFALDGYQAPLETIKNIEQPDPLIALNASFRSAYADLRSQLQATQTPVIIQVGDKIILFNKGMRTESMAISPRYTELKTIAHLPLALYVMLSNETNKVMTDVQLDKLRDYRTLIGSVSNALATLNFSSEQLDRQGRLIKRSLSLIDTVLSHKIISKDALHQFTLSQRDDCLANMSDAAEEQINTLDHQFKSWVKDMTPEERQHIRVVVGASHMPRIGNLAMQYFSAALAENFEGRYVEEGSSKDNSFRLIYGENVFDEEKALRLLGTHLIDADIGTNFFNDAQRMHRDLLSDAAEKIIGKKIKSKEIVPLQ